MKSFWKLICIVTLCLTFGVLLALPITAQSRIVEDVEIRGYKSVALDEIKKRVLSAPGKEFSATQAVSDFDRVLEIGRFDPLQSSLEIRNGVRGGKIIVFDLKEKP